MERVGWVTDPHLNFVPSIEVHAFCERIAEADPDILLVGGDVAEAQNFEAYLLTLEHRLQRPIYFVLGNHDFYRGSIGEVRARARLLTQRAEWLKWLAAEGVVAITETTGLVGHGSWADGRFGNAARSRVMLNDYVLIDDFKSLDVEARFEKLNALGDEAAAYFEDLLPQALERFRHLLLLTHVPPFKEASWHDGRPTGEDWLPHFSCKAVGDVILRASRAYPGCEITVLCGHTHGAGDLRLAPNLRVITGGAEYGEPQLQEPIEVE